ncbi:hypothetical protein [Paenibacillus sp. Marseille-Q4541]|nr:hypothetical protein [Paenibacillus sp. Marseille-Q4541]
MIKSVNNKVWALVGMLFVAIASIETQTGSWLLIGNKPVPQSMKK